MAAMRKPSDAPIYQLKVTLKGSKPPIWRRVLVPADVNLARLHEIILRAMGWIGGHLHQFLVGGVYYGEPHPDYGDEMRSERRVKLSQAAPRAGARFTYEYDFGDSWEHQIVVETILPAEAGAHYPICIAGKRACPPEDCGGVWGYAELLEAIRDPQNPEHEELREWVGEDFDPEAFDLEEINDRLKHVR